jgi:hypothetical protein
MNLISKMMLMNLVLCFECLFHFFICKKKREKKIVNKSHSLDMLCCDIFKQMSMGL